MSLSDREKCKNVGLSDEEADSVVESCRNFGYDIDQLLGIYCRYGRRPLSDYVVDANKVQEGENGS